MARPQFRYREAWALLKLGRLAESVRAVALGLADDPLGTTSWLLHLVGAEATTATGDYRLAAAHIEAARDPHSTPEAEIGRTYLATVRAELALAEHRDADVLQIVEPSLRHLGGLTEYVDYLETGWWLTELGLAALSEQAELGRAADLGSSISSARGTAAELVDLLDGSGKTVITAASRHRHDRPLRRLIAGHLAGSRATMTRGSGSPPRRPSAAVGRALNARYRQRRRCFAGRASREEVAAVMTPPMRPRLRSSPAAGETVRGSRPTGPDQSPPSRCRAHSRSAHPSRGSSFARQIALHKRGLSDREIEVLTLVAAGYSNSDIAERLFISSKTASVHVSHILDKLGVSTRTEAATVGVRLGLPEVDAD
jgi:DNA-binding CsgD family transcriptional regulator